MVLKTDPDFVADFKNGFLGAPNHGKLLDVIVGFAIEIGFFERRREFVGDDLDFFALFFHVDANVLVAQYNGRKFVRMGNGNVAAVVQVRLAGLVVVQIEIRIADVLQEFAHAQKAAAVQFRFHALEPQLVFFVECNLRQQVGLALGDFPDVDLRMWVVVYRAV